MYAVLIGICEEKIVKKLSSPCVLIQFKIGPKQLCLYLHEGNIGHGDGRKEKKKYI